MDGNTPERVEILALDEIAESPTNPRKRFNEQALRELATDILSHGVLNPVIVRLIPDARQVEVDPTNVAPYELVCGARRVRASKLAGKTTIPAIVRELDDRAALEVQVSENGQRDDVSPLEHGDAFLALHTTHHVAVDDIAVRFGHRRAYVHERLALARMCDDARAALDLGTIGLGVALKIARLPSHDYQREALKGITQDNTWAAKDWTVAEAGAWIASRFHLRLASAPFDPLDEALTSAGACAVCPKNTETQRDLFGEELSSGAAQCTDPRCFAAKKEAAWVAASAEHRNAGRKVLSADESSQIVQAFGCHGGYARADIAPTEHGGRRTWKQLLGVHYPATVIARAPNGDAVEIIEPEALKAAVKAAGLGKTKVSKGGDEASAAKGKPDAKADASNAEARIREAITEAQAHAAVCAAEDPPNGPGDPGAWWMVVRVLMLSGDQEAVWRALEAVTGQRVEQRGRRDAAKPYDGAAVERWLKTASANHCMAFVGAYAVFCDLDPDDTKDLMRAIKLGLGVDSNDIEKKVRAAAAKVDEPQKLVKLAKGQKPVKKGGAK